MRLCLVPSDTYLLMAYIVGGMNVSMLVTLVALLFSLQTRSVLMDPPV